MDIGEWKKKFSKAYDKQQNYDSQKKRANLIVHRQCSEALHAHLMGNEVLSNIKNSQGVSQLLKFIQKIVS